MISWVQAFAFRFNWYRYSTGLKFALDCFYDSPTQIRCISPMWYPNGSTALMLGDLKPCFEAYVVGTVHVELSLPIACKRLVSTLEPEM